VLDPLIDLLSSRTPLYPPWGRVVVIDGLFALAWLIARSSAFLARHILAWHDRRHSESDLEATGKMVNIKRRETLVSVIRTGIAYTAFGAAAVLSVGQLTGGIDRLTAIAGASYPRNESEVGERSAAYPDRASRAGEIGSSGSTNGTPASGDSTTAIPASARRPTRSSIAGLAPFPAAWLPLPFPCPCPCPVAGTQLWTGRLRSSGALYP
jgi:hypothetical protein